MLFAPTITLNGKNSISTKFQSQMDFVKYCSDNRLVRCQHILCVRLFLFFKTKLTVFFFIVWLRLYFHNNNMTIVTKYTIYSLNTYTKFYRNTYVIE